MRRENGTNRDVESGQNDTRRRTGSNGVNLMATKIVERRAVSDIENEIPSFLTP